MPDDFSAEMDKVAAQYSGGETTAEPEAPAPEPVAETSHATTTLPDPETVTDDMPYRDAKALRDELAQGRERWKPYEEAFGGLSDADRAAVIAAAPNLGADMAQISQQFSGLHPDDRAVMLDIASKLNDDPIGAAELFARAADVLRGGDSDARVEGLDDDLDGDEPLTRAEFEAKMAERDQLEVQRAEQRAQDRAQEQILTEARELGYDPDGSSPEEHVRFLHLLSVAQGNPDGNLKDAHEAILAYEQSIRDKYADGKREDSQRAQAPGAGGSPNQERVLESMDDAEGAMRARLDASFGPNTRR